LPTWASAVSTATAAERRGADALADELPPEDAQRVRRAAGGVGRFAGGVLSDVAQAELKGIGGSAVS
jgi:hypothetical protein